MKGTMRAAIVEKPGIIVIKNVPIPEINEDEVLIKVKVTGICGTDWSIYTGKYSAESLPLIPGHEFSGIITEVGRNAKGLKAGDRVTADINLSCGICFYCRRGNKLLCKDFTQIGIHTNGSFAEYVKVPWEQVHKLPENLSFEAGAFIEPVSCVVHSAKALNVELGSSVAVIGCGLGILHGALSKLRGAAPIIVIGDNESRLKIAQDMCADFVININKVKDVISEVKKLTEGRGADYVIEAVGTVKTYEQAFEMLRPGGTIAGFGITGFDDTMKVRPFDIVLNEKKLVSSCAGVGNDWNDAIRLLQYQRIKPEKMFSMEVPLEELEPALKQLREDPELIKVFVSPEINKRIIF